MTKEEIVKELDELGNVLYNKFGTDSYLERCTIHDLKTKIKALIIADVVNCLSCGKNHAEICGSCVSDMAQATGEQAIQSR